MRTTSICSILSLVVASLVAGCTAPANEPEGDVDDGAVIDPETKPSALLPPCCGIPVQFVNLRPWPQIVVRRPGVQAALIIAANTNVNLPCDATTVYFDLSYNNSGNTAAGAHNNRAFWNNSLNPWQTESQPGLAPGASATSTFTRSIANTIPNTPYQAWFRVDDPSAVAESVENDNAVSIRVTRVCP